MSEKFQYYSINTNPGTAPCDAVPCLDYDTFSRQTIAFFKNPEVHCLNYFASVTDDKVDLIMCLANDGAHEILIYKHQLNGGNSQLNSLTVAIPALYIFEREISENTGIQFLHHPWMKPVRFPWNAKHQLKFKDYPFLKYDSDEIHEVGVGPIHAGIIEPGHFRFLCNGEKNMHLEIQLGFQHRGIEHLMINKNNLLQRSVLSDSIAGDTAVGHATAFCGTIEALKKCNITNILILERTLALEMERMAIHIGDTAALCNDVAYQLGQVVCEALRTIVINSTQLWCGNRFGKSFIRPCGTHYPINENIIHIIRKNLEDVYQRYEQMAERLFTLPSFLSRLDNISKLTTEQVNMIGAVGMSARMAGLKRDVRWSHPFLAFDQIPFQPEILETGDLLARALIRQKDITSSYQIIQKCFELCLSQLNNKRSDKPDYEENYLKQHIAISVTEAWRGETVHIGITDEKGKLRHYKIKDPSFHNWMALAQVMRYQEISDFPVNNKSFNLSYCGFDL